MKPGNVGLDQSIQINVHSEKHSKCIQLIGNRKIKLKYYKFGFENTLAWIDDKMGSNSLLLDQGCWWCRSIHLNSLKTKYELIIYNGSAHSILVSLFRLWTCSKKLEKKKSTTAETLTHHLTTHSRIRPQNKVRHLSQRCETHVRIHAQSFILYCFVQAWYDQSIPAISSYSISPYFWEWLFLSKNKKKTIRQLQQHTHICTQTHTDAPTERERRKNTQTNFEIGFCVVSTCLRCYACLEVQTLFLN